MSFFGHDSRVRVIGQRFFYQFGLHCATHQIRLILVSAVVITSLLYPALAIYSSSQPQFLARISSKILESVAGEGLSSYHSYHDLHDPWSGYDTLHVREDSVARARCGTEGILRVERLLIHSALPEDAGALNNQILLSTLQLERRLDRALSTTDMGCLRRSDGTCFAFSPVAFWNYDEDRLLSDEDMLDTLQRTSNVSIQDILITPQMVLAGRELDDHSNLDFARFLALTYVFHETSCLDSSGHSAWVGAVRQAAGRIGDLTVVAKEPTLLALEYKGSKDTDTRSSALYTFTWLTYFALLIYAYRMSRTVNNLHSRLGVALTGVIEILASTVTSLSVCALAGFKITMIPWEFFPVLITFVGIENMFALVGAIYSTPITLPVKDRVAKGLSRAGTSNSLKCFVYNSILGVIAGLSGGAIRQFCAFAVVVLVAHWFLAHTFFVTVLSIDLQRLELEELLQQAPDIAESDSESQKQSKAAGAQNLKGRVNKNVTLLLLLAITGILYYSTKRAGVSNTKSPFSRGALSRGKHGAEVVPAHSPASSIWRLFNPNDDPLVHLRMEAPTVLMLRPDVTQSMDPRAYQRLRFPARTIRRLIWLLKIFIAPILATVGVLYGLLLYLLRDAQLLDARHDRPNEERANTDPPIGDNVSFVTLPRAFPTDAEFIAASDDGRRIAAVGTQNEFTIWNARNNERQCYIATDATDLLMRTPGTLSNQATITALTLSGDGSMCAIGTGAGMVFAWSFGKSGIVSVPQLPTGKNSFSVTGLRFSPARSSGEPLRLLTTYDNGVALEWWVDGSGHSREITPSRPMLVSKCGIVPSSTTITPAVAFFMEDGTLELCGAFQEFYPTPDFCVAAGNPSDHVFQVHVADILIGGQTRIIVAATTRAGVISIWDWETGECITILDDRFGETNGLRLSPVTPKTCQFCGATIFDSFLLSFSVGQIVIVYRAFLMEGSTRKCSCPQNQPQRALNVGVDLSPSKRKRSRQSSVASSGNSSPRLTRSRNPSLSETTISSGVLPTFPVSGHGIHSRRVTEKDSLRRAVELMILPIPSAENEDAEKSPPRTYTSLTAGRSHVWENLVAVRVAVVNFERGKWEVVDEKVVGLRRRPLNVGKPSEKCGVQLRPGSASGLSPASLERWELWTFDPFVGKTQASALASLEQGGQDDALTDLSRFKTAFSVQNGIVLPEPVPRLPFTRISSFLCRGNRFLAGFGNTIGVLTWKTPHVSQRKPGLP